MKELCDVQADSHSQTANWSSNTVNGAAFAMALSQAKYIAQLCLSILPMTQQPGSYMKWAASCHSLSTA